MIAEQTNARDAVSGYISGNPRSKFSPMPQSKPKSLSAYRRRLKQRGVVRVEVHVHKNDAALVRSVARALSDPAVETETRVLLRERFGVAKAKGLKEFLASAPLEGLDLTRKRDVGRKVEL
jgi:hypothetical protein